MKNTKKNTNPITDLKTHQAILAGLMVCKSTDKHNPILDELIDKVKKYRMTKEVLEQAVAWIVHTEQLLKEEIDSTLDRGDKAKINFETKKRKLEEQLTSYETLVRQIAA